MCLFSDPAGSAARAAADSARMQENQREDRIGAGRAAIDSTFSKFDDPYFSGVGKSYADYYQPQLQDQYDKARRRLILSLSQSGNLNASAGARQIGDLTTQFKKLQAQIGAGSSAAEQAARASVESNRSNLYNQNTAAADPGAANASAIASYQSLTTPQQYSPLGDVFANFGNQAANAVSAERAGMPGWGLGIKPVAGPTAGPTTGAGSSYLVR